MSWCWTCGRWMPLGIITGLCEECRAKWHPVVAAEAAQ